ncbi:hypothetical protein MMON_19830 [Mycolicibacterium monacense]|uniref:Uncharacterized protein n=1 Tax=Mycolicibacterium monacense TaxID=85693 RepID=A0AAD1MZ83_MYCMB|nr:hypothetical protein MMON_19830 [Mycolicibacterium monacense]
MRARRVAAVTDVEDLPNLGEAEPGGLSPSDEADPGDRVGGIVAIPRRGTFGGREQAFVFVVAQRRGGGPGRLGELPDSHDVSSEHLTFKPT